MEVTLVVVDQILKTKKKKKIPNKLILEILAAVVVDLEMVKDQDKELDKV